MNKRPGGYVKTPRDFWDYVAWECQELANDWERKVYYDLFMMANYEERTITKNGQDIVIPRGSLGKSVKTLAKRWGKSEPAIKRLLNKWEKLGLIGITRHKQGKKHLLNVINFPDYDKIAAFKREPWNEPSNDP